MWNLKMKKNSRLHLCMSTFVTRTYSCVHTPGFFHVCGSVGACVLLWHIESIPKPCSLQCSRGLGATHLSSWSLLVGTATVILIGSHYWAPAGGHASLVQSRFEGGLKWRIKKCGWVCVDFIDETEVYSGYYVTFVWCMDIQRALFEINSIVYLVLCLKVVLLQVFAFLYVYVTGYQSTCVWLFKQQGTLNGNVLDI